MTFYIEYATLLNEIRRVSHNALVAPNGVEKKMNLFRLITEGDTATLRRAAEYEKTMSPRARKFDLIAGGVVAGIFAVVFGTLAGMTIPFAMKGDVLAIVGTALFGVYSAIFSFTALFGLVKGMKGNI